MPRCRLPGFTRRVETKDLNPGWEMFDERLVRVYGAFAWCLDLDFMVTLVALGVMNVLLYGFEQERTTIISGFLMEL